MDNAMNGPVVRVMPGCTVSIILRGDGKVTAGEGKLGGSRGFGIEVELRATAYLKPEAEVVLAAGEPGSRAVALARFKQMRGNTAVFMRQSPWRPVDARAFSRYPARISATVHGAGGGKEVKATTLDISLGGVAVSVPGQVALEGLEISLGRGAERLPCRVVSARPGEGATILHLAFGDLPDESHARIERLVARLRIQAEAEAASVPAA